MADAEFDCKYQGFVHADTDQADKRPSTQHVNQAHTMLSKKNLKKTREIHPLFGRGIDTPLKLKVSQLGLVVCTAEGDKILNTSMHKIAFAASVEKSLGVIMKRPGVGKFKCHLFAFDTAATAEQAGLVLKKTANAVFQKLRRVKAVLDSKPQPPQLPERAPAVKDEDQKWFHGPLTRQDADKLLLSGTVVNGLFLVRQSPSCATDYAIDFCYSGKTYHNRVRKNAAGEYENSKGSKFPSLTAMIHNYQSPQADMQTMLTEYVPNTPVNPDGPDGPVYANVALLRNPDAAQGGAWRLADVEAALKEISGEAPAADDTGDIVFDPIYDDNRFGFGDEFVATALGIALVAEVDTLEGTDFNLGKLDTDC